MPRRRNCRFAGSYGPAARSDENNNGTRAGFASSHSDDGNSNSDSDPNGCKSVFDRGASQIPLQRRHRCVGQSGFKDLSLHRS